MNILVIDIGDTKVKLWKTEEAEKTKFPSGKEPTPKAQLEGVRADAAGRPIERISIGGESATAVRWPIPKCRYAVRSARAA